MVVRNEGSGSREVRIRNPDDRITDQGLGSGSKIKRMVIRREKEKDTLCFYFVLGTEDDEFKILNVRNSAESPILIAKSPRTMAGS